MSRLLLLLLLFFLAISIAVIDAVPVADEKCPGGGRVHRGRVVYEEGCWDTCEELEDLEDDCPRTVCGTRLKMDWKCY